MSKKKILLLCMSMLIAAVTNAGLFAAPKKTIHVIPETAKIYIDGQFVGTGVYSVKFSGGTEYFNIRVEAPGYLTRRYRLLKDNPQKDVTYTLPEDEAIKNTIGYTGGTSGGASDYVDDEITGAGLANKWFDVHCKKGLTEDVVWKRLISVCINYFSDLEVRDKSAGWLRSKWSYQPFPNQVVRTRVEIRMSFSDDDVLTYKVRLQSEIRDREDGAKAPFQKFNYLLKKYEELIGELQTTVGSNL
ncbi:MAG: hypothetical protein K2M94_02245 [Paramuribaculum sp.]|nr:hypothetical protein [Paramuribaculum sp.]